MKTISMAGMIACPCVNSANNVNDSSDPDQDASYSWLDMIRINGMSLLCQKYGQYPWWTLIMINDMSMSRWARILDVHDHGPQ